MRNRGILAVLVSLSFLGFANAASACDGFWSCCCCTAWSCGGLSVATTSVDPAWKVQVAHEKDDHCCNVSTSSSCTAAVTCHVAINGTKKYTLTGNLSYNNCGLSAGYESTTVTATDCGLTASTAGPGQCIECYGYTVSTKTVYTGTEYCTFWGSSSTCSATSTVLDLTGCDRPVTSCTCVCPAP